MAFATLLVWRLQTDACGVGASGFWRYRMPPYLCFSFFFLKSVICRQVEYWKVARLTRGGSQGEAGPGRPAAVNPGHVPRRRRWRRRHVRGRANGPPLSFSDSPLLLEPSSGAALPTLRQEITTFIDFIVLGGVPHTPYGQMWLFFTN